VNEFNNIEGKGADGHDARDFPRKGNCGDECEVYIGPKKSA
jgi:hypothetical protein